MAIALYFCSEFSIIHYLNLDEPLKISPQKTCFGSNICNSVSAERRFIKPTKH